MARKKKRSFLERAMEVLGDKHPGVKPTQVALAKVAGVKQPTVSEWQEPDRYAEIANGIRICEYTGCSLDWLYFERGEKYPASTEGGDEFLGSIHAIWPQLDEEKKRQLARYSDFIRDDKK